MRLFLIAGMIFSMLVTFGCAPSVKLKRLKPAEVDMSSMRRLAVPDIGYYRGGVDSVEDFVIGIIANSVGVSYGEDYQVREAASYAGDKLFNALQDTEYFEIVDVTFLSGTRLYAADDISKIGATLSADAVLVGEITYASCNLEEFTREKSTYNSQLKREVVVQIPWLRQNCRLTFSYKVISTEGNILKIKKRFTEYREEEVEKRKRIEIHDPEYWYKDILDGIIPQIAQQLAPYTIYETRSMKTDRLDDPEIKRAMALTKEGELSLARDIFLQCWQSTSNPAAGYNAAVLYEAEGMFEDAVKLLEEVMTVSNDNSIIWEYNRVLDVLEERKLAEEQMK